MGDLPEPSRVAPRQDSSECDRHRRLSTALRRVAVCRGVPDRVLGSPHHLLREGHPVKGVNVLPKSRGKSDLLFAVAHQFCYAST